MKKQLSALALIFILACVGITFTYADSTTSDGATSDSTNDDDRDDDSRDDNNSDSTTAVPPSETRNDKIKNLPKVRPLPPIRAGSG
ncbi:hypothetical protein LDC_1537 [sediment metagenome]|uniref:Uncharacterized protein n=1 Tax=sediment metagenome TaxID=749907 RepID=D9PJ28_9ZZZZ